MRGSLTITLTLTRSLTLCCRCQAPVRSTMSSPAPKGRHPARCVAVYQPSELPMIPTGSHAAPGAPARAAKSAAETVKVRAEACAAWLGAGVGLGLGLG